MRTKIVAGNWKMNKTYQETKALVKELKHAVKEIELDNTRVVIAPTFVNLQKASKMTKNSVIEVAAQNMHQAASGAYTGEISAQMLKSIYVDTVILGHSERREYFGETDELLAEKVDAALANDLEIIFCFFLGCLLLRPRTFLSCGGWTTLVDCGGNGTVNGWSFGSFGVEAAITCSSSPNLG